MNLILNIAIIAFIVAQFTPKGQAFLSTPKGAATTVVISALAILMMIPGLLSGHIVDALFIGLWGYIAYPRLSAAKAFLKDSLRRLRIR